MQVMFCLNIKKSVPSRMRTDFFLFSLKNEICFFIVVLFVRMLEPSVTTLRNTHCEWVLFLTVYLLAGCLKLAVG